MTEAEQCGWLKDKYGLSWQIVPRQLDDMVFSKHHARSLRVWKALLTMKRLVLANPQKAYEG